MGSEINGVINAHPKFPPDPHPIGTQPHHAGECRGTLMADPLGPNQGRNNRVMRNRGHRSRPHAKCKKGKNILECLRCCA